MCPGSERDMSGHSWLRLHGEITVFTGWFSDSVKMKIPFNFKVTLQEDHIETPEEDFLCLNTYKQKYTLE